MFNERGYNRLVAWKQFRDRLETSNSPLEDVVELWASAPFVNPYLNPYNPKEWPDPWHLVIDSRLDDLAIVLGMLYTLQLTQRFAKAQFEVCMSIIPSEKHPIYFLLVDNQNVLNLEYKRVLGVNSLENINSIVLWSTGKD